MGRTWKKGSHLRKSITLAKIGAFWKNVTLGRKGHTYKDGSLKYRKVVRGKFLTKLWCCVGGKYNKIIWFHQLG